MEPAPPTPALAPDETTCGECGKVLSKRGLAGHLRLAHGVVRRREPVAPLPAAREVDLGPVLAVLARIEQRLERLEAHGRSQGSATGETSGGPAQELQAVLGEIAELRAQGSQPDASDEERRTRLGELRRRQAELLYELDPRSEAARAILESAFG